MRKESWIPIALFGLAIAFVAVSAMVWLSRGRSRFWLERKLHVGGLLLALGGFASTGCPPVVTCYEAVQNNYIELEDLSYTIELDLSQGNTLSGSVHERVGETFSFAVFDAADALRQAQDIDAADGAFDEASEEFEIAIDETLESGTYALRFFDVVATDVSGTSQHHLADYQLVISAP